MFHYIITMFPNMQLAGVKMKLNELREELDECVKGQNFTRAAELQKSVADLQLEKSAINEALQPQIEEVRIEKVNIAESCRPGVCILCLVESLKTCYYL